MLRLTEALFRLEPQAKYADYYERGLYNHILASQHPRHGGYVYMTPMRPRHYRVYSQPEQCFWCCVGSGMENHGKYGRFIYAASDEALYVNLFVASELDRQAKGVKIRQATRFPVQAGSALEFSMSDPTTFSLKVRRPAWATGDFAVKVNGEAQSIEGGPSTYVSIDREWQNGDSVEIALPMQIHLEQLPDNSDYAAVMFGPLALAAATGEEDLEGLVADDGRFAHIASGPEQPLDEAPLLVGSLEEITAKIKPTDAPLTFTATEAIEPDKFDKLKLRPFYQVHDARYEIYWPIESSEE